jgi:predicted nucleic acid-binding protein
MNKVFVDSNIWLYSYIQTQDSEKYGKANLLIKSLKDKLFISSQLLNEIAVNLIRKAKFKETELRQLLASKLNSYQVLNFEPEYLLLASTLREKYMLSYWDSIHIACSLSNSIEVFYSEDLQHGLIVENSLKIINPFYEEKQ